MTAWQSPETAPKDRMILADFGGPHAVVAFWSTTDEAWCYAGADYNWFVTESPAEPLNGWMELPEVSHG